MRGAVVMVDVARVAAFNAVVLWTFRFAHNGDSKPAYARRKAQQRRLFGLTGTSSDRRSSSGGNSPAAGIRTSD